MNSLITIVSVLVVLFAAFRIHVVASTYGISWLAALKLSVTNIFSKEDKYPLGFLRTYRIQDFNGQDKDLVITHEKLMKHPKLHVLEKEFLVLPFGEEASIGLTEDYSSYLFDDFSVRTELRVTLITQSVDTESMVAFRLQQISKE